MPAAAAAHGGYGMKTSTETLDGMDVFAARADDATRKGAQAFARLLQLAETRDSGQIARIARFIAATYNGQAFALDPFELRAVDIAISDDILCCLDALRWGRADLYTLVPDGDARVRAVIDRWGLRWPDDM
ncbi:DUF7673 family protein [Aquabacterium sp.]|uniref:DUF7673 family protein n=1 Tax=Aquabacterium sp. TaxID=1872578 RepID=UPI002B8A6416|nr:hypothetical protein [Aquabacterium sp.]HSW08438.1 hypothetical protein [Aquabacterium sp.]